MHVHGMKKNVLILYSYSPGRKTLNNELEGIWTQAVKITVSKYNYTQNKLFACQKDNYRTAAMHARGIENIMQ